jgi:hypothetical protein
MPRCSPDHAQGNLDRTEVPLEEAAGERGEEIMGVRVADRPATGIVGRAAARWRGVAWLVIVIADIGLLAWGAGAALLPKSLPGPGSAPILPAGFEGYTGGSWQHLVATSPKTAGYITLVFRMYGIYIIAFSLLAIAIATTAYRRGERWAWWALLVGNSIAWISAMTYDQIVGAIGPFELTEYLGLALIYVSLALTVPSSRRDGSAKAGAR